MLATQGVLGKKNTLSAGCSLPFQLALGAGSGTAREHPGTESPLRVSTEAQSPSPFAGPMISATHYLPRPRFSSATGQHRRPGVPHPRLSGDMRAEHGPAPSPPALPFCPSHPTADLD